MLIRMFKLTTYEASVLRDYDIYTSFISSSIKAMNLVVINLLVLDYEGNPYFLAAGNAPVPITP